MPGANTSFAAAAAPQQFDAQPVGLLAAKIAGVTLDRKTRARLGRGDSPRSGQPVWRNSYYVGQIEHEIWKPINGGSKRGGARWVAAMLGAAKAYELRTLQVRREKEPGARNGDLGRVGLAVLEYLYGKVDYASGRLDPAIRTIADALGFAYSAVHRALVRLADKGFLNWMRRSRPIENLEPGGPQVKQASNAYALLVPESMRTWLARLIGQDPTPACEEDRLKRAKADFDAMVAGLSAAEYARDFVRDTLLGPTLRSLAAAVDRREQQERESSKSDETGGSLYDP
jgi:hypothetical protein